MVGGRVGGSVWPVVAARRRARCSSIIRSLMVVVVVIPFGWFGSGEGVGVGFNWNGFREANAETSEE